MGGTHSKQKMDVIGRSSKGFGNYAQRFDRTTPQRIFRATWTCNARCVDGIHGSRTPAGVLVVYMKHTGGRARWRGLATG